MLTYTPLAVAFCIGSLVAGRLASKFGWRVLLAGGLIAALGFAGILAAAFAAGGNLTVSLLIAPLILVGLGNGLLLPQLPSAVLARIRPEETGMASGMTDGAGRAALTGQQAGADRSRSDSRGESRVVRR